MNLPQYIPPYRSGNRPKEQERDVSAKMLHQQSKRARSAEKKSRKMKKQYKQEKAQRKAAEHRLAQEHSKAAREKVVAILQTKLNDLAFYRGEAAES